MSVSTATQLPIVKIAAGAVIVLSAVGVGVMTGLIPGVSSKERPVNEIVEAAPVAPRPAPAVTPAAKPKTAQAAAPVRETKRAASVCVDCGVVQSVNTVEVKGEGTGAGAIAGAVGGLIVGNQIGSGRGKTLAKVAGAAGGAYAGHQIEKHVRRTVQYQVALRMDDGSHRTLMQANGEALSPGTRVRIVDGAAIPN